MTATTVFPFTPIQPYREQRVTATNEQALGGGYAIRREELPTPGWFYRARMTLRLPKGSNTLKTWFDWIETYGGSTGFLYKAPNVVARTSSNYNPNREVVGLDIGTGNGTDTDFPLTRRHIDASNLTVYVNSVEQGSGWSLVDNDTANPIIRFTSPVTSGHDVEVDHHFYIPVVFKGSEDPVHRGGQWVVPGVVLEEEQPGLHRA